MAWLTVDQVAALLGPSSGWGDDPTLAQSIVDASTAVAIRRRREAGYTDDPDLSPGPDVTMGCALYAVALWRERASTDGYASFEEFAAFTPTGGSWGQIRRLWGVGRAAVDAPTTVTVTPLGRVRALPHGGR